MNELLKQYLQGIANQVTLTEKMDREEGTLNDWCAGNIDDAYEMGVEDGEIQLARDLLNRFNKD